MTSRRQRLQSSHAINNGQDSPCNASELENAAHVYSVGTLTSSSTLNTNHNLDLTNGQRFPLYQGETSCSQPSMSSQNQHDHRSFTFANNQSCSSHSSSQLFIRDLIAADSASVNQDLMSSVNEQLTIGQASYQRKRKSSLLIYFLCFSCIYIAFFYTIFVSRDFQ